MTIKFFSLKINLASGGGSHYTLDLKLRYLLSRGHKVSLTTLYSGENKFKPKQNPPYQIIEEGFEGGFLDMQKYVCKLLQKNDADLFHIDGQSFIWGAGMYKKLGGKIPTVAYINNYSFAFGFIHQDYQHLPLSKKLPRILIDWQYNKKRWLWEKFIGLKYTDELDAIFFPSPFLRQKFADFGYKNKKLEVLPEFIDIAAFLNSPKDEKPPFEKQKGGFYINYTGRLVYDKGVDLLIEALGKIDDGNIFLIIVGDGPQKGYLQNLITKYGLQNRVWIFPWIKDKRIAEFYRHCDIFVHPCRWPEPLGRTIVEAMIFGKPIITSSHSGSAWAMGHGGLTFKKNNTNDLKNKILFFKNNPADLRQYGLAAKLRADEFDYHLFTEKFEKSLLELTLKN